MVTGQDVLGIGYPQGPVVGLALKVAERTAEEGLSEYVAIQRLKAVLEEPHFFLNNDVTNDLAREVILIQTPEPSYEVARSGERDFGVWGPSLIDANTYDQMENAMRLPITVDGALMPDAHLGYGLPVGGVLATKGAVIPWAVGVDIACRMRLSIFSPPVHFLDQESEGLREILIRNTVFGPGGKFRAGRRTIAYSADGTKLPGLAEHPILDDPAWDETSFLRDLKDTAAAQLGTSGGGNHFVEWGVFEHTGEHMDDMKPSYRGDKFLALLSHSGSRGVGFKIANHFSKIAKKKRVGLPKELEDLSWLGLDEEEGAEYWLSMELAGRFAAANHEVIHSRISKALELNPMKVIENHHNWAFKEEHEGEEVIVHRKGATPAGSGVLGVIPGSMGDPGYVVRGKGNPHSLNSASHGAGRTMSRTQAHKTLDAEKWRSYLEEKNVELVGGGLDEAPAAYKDIDEVVSLQTDLVDLVGSFTPRIVRMDLPRSKRRR